MARYKHIDTNPKLLPADLARQLLPGTFEHAVHHLLEHAIDLSRFDARFRNDATGAAAYPPAMLLKVVLVAYAHGIVGSRGIAAAQLFATRGPAACRCTRRAVVSLAPDSAPHLPRTQK